MDNNLAYRAFKIVNESYPGFLVEDRKGFHFAHRGISSSPLIYNTSIIMGAEVKCISFFGQDFELNLFWDAAYGKNYFNMYYDFGLSFEACMSLYSIGAAISYNDKVEGRKYYDRTNIERQWTIKNIINE